MHQFDMRTAWEQASRSYLAARGEDVHDVSYGALAPGEANLGLLGDLRGRRVLDVGCGGGNNAVACARSGAVVTGVEISNAMLVAAKRLAKVNGANINLVQGDIGADCPAFGSDFTRVLAIQVLGYVSELAVALRRLHAALAPDGLLVASIDHPVRSCFYDAEGEDLASVPLRSYFDTRPLAWRFDNGASMRSRHLPLGGWIDEFAAAGLRLERLIEPCVPADLADELWPEDSPLAPLREIPHSAIFVLSA